MCQGLLAAALFGAHRLEPRGPGAADFLRETGLSLPWVKKQNPEIAVIDQTRQRFAKIRHPTTTAPCTNILPATSPYRAPFTSILRQNPENHHSKHLIPFSTGIAAVPHPRSASAGFGRGANLRDFWPSAIQRGISALHTSAASQIERTH